MPLEKTKRDEILRYCDQDLPKKPMVESYFSFIGDAGLRSALAQEYLAARYIYKLGEAVYADGDKLEAHAKFQIVQYASIYEACIVYLLWEKYGTSDHVTSLEYHDTFRRVAGFAKGISVTSADGATLELGVPAKEKTPIMAIKFPDKVDAAVKIGFLNSGLGDEIKEFYRLRNGMHIEAAVKKGIKYELDQAELAFRRMLPFTLGIKGFLKDGVLPLEGIPEAYRTATQPIMEA